MNKADTEFFDNIAPHWDDSMIINSERIGHILDVAGITECHNILDVGTGTGVLIPFYIERANQDVRIDAVDVSEGMLRQARRKFGSFENVSFILNDVEEGHIDKTYDCIMLYNMYPHLLKPEETVEWLSKVNLNPGGNLVIAFDEGKDAINGHHNHQDGTTHAHKLPKVSELKSHFQSKGLMVDYCEDTPQCYIIRITNPV